jgi:hypothetical protein
MNFLPDFLQHFAALGCRVQLLLQAPQSHAHHVAVMDIGA